MIDRCPYNSHALVNDSQEQNEGGSMHVRRMAKDASDENVSNFTSSPTLLARVEPPFVHFPAYDPFLPPSSLLHLLIYVHLARSRDSLFFSLLSLFLSLLAILPALQKLSAVFLLLFFFRVIPSFFVSYSFSPSSSFFLYFLSFS